MTYNSEQLFSLLVAIQKMEKMKKMKKIHLLTIFISSFLLFQIQPLLGKITTPYFGGSAATWTSCMFFFQTFLLVGYLYSHNLSKLIMLNQIKVHSALVLICFSFMPLSVEFYQLNLSEDLPVLDVLTTLFFAVGLPYMLLSTTVPLLHKWYSINQDDSESKNYYFYALSNVGAVLGLISYPFVTEPHLTIGLQQTIWSVIYFVYSLFLLFIIWTAFKNKPLINITVETDRLNAKLSLGLQAYWTLQALTGVVLLLSITNAMTQNIPPVPFLWVLPLVIYLTTYIVSFSNINVYQRWFTGCVFSLSALGIVFLYHTSTIFDLYSQIIIYCITLASGCMICHGELSKSSPKEQYLTNFYLSISLGGFLGGLLVSVISPLVFDEFLELPISIVLTMVLLLWNVKKDEPTRYLKLKQTGGVSAVGLFLLLFFTVNSAYKQYDVYSTRNFYGTLSVKDINTGGISERRLVDGITSHGAQSLSQSEKHLPLGYYRHESGVGRLLNEVKKHGNLNMGIIGLGAGTLAAYGEAQDTIIFYELNPNVIRIAGTYFSYLSDSKANVTTVLGDGRLSLSKRDPEQAPFNVFVVDAFSSDSIPKHLLTIEAFELYWNNLEKDGVLAIHISNNYIDLLPVIKAAATELETELVYFSQGTRAENGSSADWVIMTNNRYILYNSTLLHASMKGVIENADELLWTDNFNSIAPLLKTP